MKTFIKSLSRDLRRVTVRRLHRPAFYVLALFLTLGMSGLAIAQGTATDGSGGDTTNTGGTASTSVQQRQLIQLQQSADTEINRRLDPLNTIISDLSHANNLPDEVLTGIRDEVNAQIKILVDLKKQIDSYSDLPSAQADVKKVNDEYPLYVLAARKGYLLVTTDFQTGLENKLNTMAAKFQKRLTAANNVGKDVSTVQITLNDLRSNLESAKQLTADVAREVPPVQPGTYETNRSVMAYHQSRLVKADGNLQDCYKDSDQIANAIAAQNL